MYKYCLLAAGEGIRNSFSKFSHKALLPVNNKAILSHLFEKLDQTIPIVIAIGYNGNYIKEYIKLAHPELDVTFIQIDKYEGKGSGPGYSLLQCKKELQCPFVLLNCDSYINEEIPLPDKNWMGSATVTNIKQYSFLEIYDNKVEAIFDKDLIRNTFSTSHMNIEQNVSLDNAFTGLAGIHNYTSFWEGFENNSILKADELQVSNGFEALIKKGVIVNHFSTWLDTGTDDLYNDVLEKIGKDQQLLKPNEFIYFQNEKVIKFFTDKTIVKNRVYRASKLKPHVPSIQGYTNNFYTYNYIPGNTLAEVSDVVCFKKMLEQFKSSLFLPIILNNKQQKKFYEDCKEFYYDKTYNRLNAFYKSSYITDKEYVINGVVTPTLNNLLNQLDWDEITNGVPTIFHGDFQPENIIVGDIIALIDWRQDFNGNIEYGDIFYDFAKLYHALIISGPIIRNKHYIIKINNNNVNLEYLIKSNLLQFLQIFEKFIIDLNYNLYKVKILTAIIYLNIAPLYSSPYRELLYFVGKHFLFNTIKEKL